MTGPNPLRAVRRIRRDRSGAASRDDPAYAAYTVVLLVLIVAAPVVRAIALWLAEPRVADALSSSGAPVAGAALGALAAASALLGGVRGPALLSPFLTLVVAGNGLPRRRTLGWPVLRAVAIVVLAFGGVAALVALVLASTGRASLTSAVVFIAAGMLAGVICSGCWLLGQWLGSTGRGLLVIALLVSTALAVLVPVVALSTPWGWLAAVFPTGGSAAPIALFAPLVALGVVAAALLAATPWLVDHLRGPALLAQSQRWQTAGTLAFTGDLATALGEFRAVPRTGRGLAAIGRRRAPLPLLFLRRDLVGSLRTPARFAAAVLGTAGAGSLVTLALGGAADVSWLLAAAAGVLGFLSLGVWADGLRHVTEAAGAPPLYGLSSLRLLTLHAIFPTVAGVVAAVAGAVLLSVAAPAAAQAAALAVTSAASPAASVPLDLLTAAASAVLLVGVRLYDSAKGPLPLALLAPVPSPFGDLSSLVIAAWQADALITAALAVLLLVWLVGIAGPGGLLVVVPFLAALAFATRRRIRIA